MKREKGNSNYSKVNNSTIELQDIAPEELKSIVGGLLTTQDSSSNSNNHFPWFIRRFE